MRDEIVRSLGLGSEAIIEPTSGGASGSAWVVRTPARRYILRLSSGPMTNGRVAAMSAARAAGLPVPELIRRIPTPDGEALLLSWLPGTTLSETLLHDPARTRRWAGLMGQMQRRLHEIAAPPEVVDILADPDSPFVAGRGVPGLPEGDRLIHLDWHPLNLLVDEAGTEIGGIVDWDNARRGSPLLDLARTRSLLTVEPSLVSLPPAVHGRLNELVKAWADGYGPAASEIPAACHEWAGRVMLADLEPRYSATPAALDGLRRWTDAWSTSS